MSALRSSLVVASVLSVIACDRGGTGKLGVSARGDGSPQAASVDVGGGISVERVRVLVQKLELERAEAMGMPMDPMDPMAGMNLVRTAEHGGDDGAEEGEVELGPVLVDVSGAALSGTVTHVFDADVPDGAYRELEIVIAPSARAGASAAVAALEGASIVVEGTRTAPGAESAAPFRFATSILAKQELETQLVVDHGRSSANVTLVLDVTKWFAKAGGGTLDPTVEANRAAIEANLLANLRFERDDDEDGVEDGHDRDG
jgi:hypothetical protein